jgi:hypothetical protein
MQNPTIALSITFVTLLSIGDLGLARASAIGAAPPTAISRNSGNIVRTIRAWSSGANSLFP